MHVGRGRGSLEAILVAELILLAHVDTWIEYGKCTSNGNEEKGRIVCAAEQDKGAIWLFTRRAGPDYYGWRLHTWLASCVEVEVHPRRGIGIPFVGQVDGRCLNVSISYLKAFQISHSVACYQRTANYPSMQENIHARIQLRAYTAIYSRGLPGALTFWRNTRPKASM